MSVSYLFRSIIYGLTAIFSLSALLNGYLWFNDYYLNISDSIPKGIYKINRLSKVQKNDLVLACLPDELALEAFKKGYIFSGNCKGHYAPVGKYICATANDRVNVASDGIWVNKTLLRNTAPLHGFTQDMNLTVDKILKKDEILLCAYRGNSYDSRYFGIGKTDWIRGTLERVWIFD